MKVCECACAALLLAAPSSLLAAAASSPEVRLASPDDHIVLTFAIRHSPGTVSQPVYSVTYRGKPMLLESGVGLRLQGSGMLGPGMSIAAVNRAEKRGDWEPVYGERSTIPENYRSAVIELVEPTPLGRRLHIELRAYNEGTALRYIVPEQAAVRDVVIEAEHTEFHLPPLTRAWETHGAQQPYENVWVKDIKPGCERPLTLEYSWGGFGALMEAGLTNYARMLFSPIPGKPGALTSDLSAGPADRMDPDPGGPQRGPADRAGKPWVWGSAPFASPWRVLIAGDRPGDLLERNYLLLNLSEPSRLASTDWIKPGKVIREVSLSTEGAKLAIDFAKARNLQYVEFDDGWYPRGDATKIRSDRQLDFQEVIRYANERGIGIILYVDRESIYQQLGVLFPAWEKWGVRGVKLGFVNVGSQHWTKWLHDAIELAGKHHLIVDVHDEYRSTGVSRTYPNLLTQEGVYGNEEMPWPGHNTVLPFTRYVGGAADYTICYYTDRIQTTRAHQLALAVVMYSPLQFLYWYDRPSAYNGEPEIEFFEHVPTVWDDTKVVLGEIGRYVSIARRSGKQWFMGTINSDAPRTLSVPLSFLPEGEKFTAHLYTSGGKSLSAAGKRVVISKTTVDSKTVLDLALPRGGGQAIRLEPQE